MQIMSPHRRRGPHKGLKLRRPKVKLSSGIKLKACDVIELYNNIHARVIPMRPVEENSFQEPSVGGFLKAGERKITLTPDTPLPKLMSGDVVSIPFGVRPNTWVPPTVPDGLGQYIYLNTPTGTQRLIWDGVMYVGSTIVISLVDGQWCMSGEVAHCFTNTCKFVSDTFPTGYSFRKISGPWANFEIIRMDVQEDDKGRIAFYTITVESLDAKNIYLQE